MIADLQEQMARLREQMTILMEDHISPRLNDACERMREHRDVMADRVRYRPLMSVLVAFIVGVVVGRAR